MMYFVLRKGSIELNSGARFEAGDVLEQVEVELILSAAEGGDFLDVVACPSSSHAETVASMVKDGSWEAA